MSGEQGLSRPRWSAVLAGAPVISSASVGRGLAMTRNASGAVAAQGLQSAASVVLQVLAARALGASTYGTYTILLGILIVLTAAQSGLRDSAIVLDRDDPYIRGALVGSQVVAGVLGGVGSFAWVLGFHLTDLAGAIVFGLVVMLWVFEEGARRLFMARQEFWKLVLNDAVYVVAAIGMLVLLRVATGGLTLNLFLVSMAAGSGVSFLTAALVQLPFGELRGGPITIAGIKQVLVFAAWRCAQSVARPMTILLARVIVAGLVSAAALGRLEVARLLIAPILVFVGGLGTYLLSHYAQEEKAQRTGNPRRAIMLPNIVMSVGIALYGVATLVWSDQLSPILTGGAFELDRLAVAGWFVFAIAFAGGIPTGNFLLARRHSRKVFELRAAGSAIGLVLVPPLVLVFGAVAVPFALSFGMFVSNWWLWRLCLGPRPSPVPVRSSGVRLAPVTATGVPAHHPYRGVD